MTIGDVSDVDIVSDTWERGRDGDGREAKISASMSSESDYIKTQKKNKTFVNSLLKCEVKKCKKKKKIQWGLKERY